MRIPASMDGTAERTIPTREEELIHTITQHRHREDYHVLMYVCMYVCMYANATHPNQDWKQKLPPPYIHKLKVICSYIHTCISAYLLTLSPPCIVVPSIGGSIPWWCV